MKKQRKPRGRFQTKIVGKAVEVWEGEPNGPESEFVCAIDVSLIPELIATLRATQPNAMKGKV